MSSSKSFIINCDKFKNKDLNLYQDLLREIKLEHSQSEGISFHSTPASENTFATFQFNCNRPQTQSLTQSWSLPWNPLIEHDENKLKWDCDLDCAPEQFKKTSDAIFKKLQTSLPHCIEYKPLSSETCFYDEIYYDTYPCYEDDEINEYAEAQLGKLKSDYPYCSEDCKWCGKHVEDE